MKKNWKKKEKSLKAMETNQLEVKSKIGLKMDLIPINPLKIMMSKKLENKII